jgi:hypothetical protein
MRIVLPGVMKRTVKAADAISEGLAQIILIGDPEKYFTRRKTWIKKYLKSENSKSESSR